MPGISVEVWPGHTRNMWAVFVRSGGKTACYISDLIPTTWHLEPTWVMAYDLFPLEVLDNRKRYYARAIPEKWLTMFTHDPMCHVPWAYLDRIKDKMNLSESRNSRVHLEHRTASKSPIHEHQKLGPCSLSLAMLQAAMVD